MSEELDPEVIADLRLRAQTERERGNRAAAAPVWTPPVIVDSWPCRHPQCSVRVDVTQDVVDQLAVFNGYLRRRNERPIPTDAVVVCDTHRLALTAYRTEQLDKKRTAMTEAVQKLKASPNARAEHELLAELKRMHHPDIDGLLQSLEAKGAGDAPTGKTRGRL